ncbi:MAG TPA: mechanosensitive ion channel family protein [Mycobacteriales bacterium]|nr:mechanosensitive ion channel family protein [Mycobacteriales bacterium]
MTDRALTLKEWVDQHGNALAAHGTRIALVLLLALVLRALLHRAVNRLVRTALTGGVFQPLKERARGTRFDASPLLSERRHQRVETLGSVLRSVASFAVGLVTGTMILSDIGLDLTPVVASAGILGVALAFGAQQLVRDVLTGVFMLLEDQYGVGDVVDTGSATGTVEAVTLRTTRLRDVDGTVWHVRNGEIARVGNRSQGWSRAIVDVPLPANADVPAVRAVLVDAARSLAADPAFAQRVLEDPEVRGVESFGTDGLVLRLTQKTAPLEQWAVERELRERVVAALGEHGPDDA